MLKYIIAFIIISCVFAISNIVLSYTNSVKFDIKKTHHGINSFKSRSTASFFQWLKMRMKEGSYPSVNQNDIMSIVSKTDMKLINSPSDLPRATWIGHAAVLVQYRGINFLTDPHLTKRPGPVNIIVSERVTEPAISYHEMPEIDFIVI